MNHVINSAIEELVHEQLARSFPPAITAAQALTHVDEPLAFKWLLNEGYGQSLLIEIVEKQFSENVSRDLFATLLNAMANADADNRGAAAQVGRMFVLALRLHIAEDLAFKAQQRYDNWEPTDAEMSRTSFAAWVDDPLIGDRRAIAGGAL